MIDMAKVIDSYYFWLTLGWIFSGVLAFGAGFLTCFFFFNYSVVGKEVIEDG